MIADLDEKMGNVNSGEGKEGKNTASSFFSRRGQLYAAFTPKILDEGTPHETGGVENEVRIFEAMEITLVLDETRKVYWNRWRENCADPKQVICKWNLTTFDTRGHPDKV